MSCPHGVWHEEDCEICVLENELAIVRAELAALRARRCETCKHANFCWIADGGVVIDTFASDFCCNQWEARP